MAQEIEASRAESKNLRNELGRFETFQFLSDPARRLLEETLAVRQVTRAEAVLHMGQPVSGAYLVLKSRLRVFTVAPNRTEATLYFLDSGEACLLAINCLVNDLWYPAWVQGETAAARCPSERFKI